MSLVLSLFSSGPSRVVPSLFWTAPTNWWYNWYVQSGFGSSRKYIFRREATEWISCNIASSSYNPGTLSSSKAFLSFWMLEVTPERRYIPSTIPCVSMNSEQHFSTIGISCPELSKCSPRSQPKTRSFKMPDCLRRRRDGRERMNDRKNEISFPCFLKTGLLGWQASIIYNIRKQRM